MMRWEEQETADCLGYSGEFAVAQVTRATGGRGRWLWEVESAARPSGWRSSGQRTTTLTARLAADEYWLGWLQAAALRPDIARLAKRS